MISARLRLSSSSCSLRSWTCLASSTSSSAIFSCCAKAKVVSRSRASASSTPLARVGLGGGGDEAFELAEVLGALAEQGLALRREVDLPLHVEDLLVELADFLARLFADGAGAEADGADFDGVAAFGEQAVGDDLLGQIADDDFEAAGVAVDGDGAGDLGLAAVERDVGDAAVDGVGGVERGGEGDCDESECCEGEQQRLPPGHDVAPSVPGRGLALMRGPTTTWCPPPLNGNVRAAQLNRTTEIL